MNPDLHQAEGIEPAQKRSAAEREFLRALRTHIRKNGGKHPNWRGVLEVLRALGYEKSGRTLP